MEIKKEQIGIRTDLATKMQFDCIEGATSHEKLKALLDVYIDCKNTSTGQIIENSVELLDMLKVNLANLEKVIIPSESEEGEVDRLNAENERLSKELELLKNKYNQLNQEYRDLVLKIELRGIKI